ncbi:L-ascorbate oxidase [Xylariomycetidae sp. FL0641]|nr:L-ascorbate oxidase [Xylariomycetidae sp. FL0641]
MGLSSRPSAIMKLPLSLLSSILLQAGFLQTCRATTVSVHDASWQPTYALVATSEVITINCVQRQSVVFNGTSPGPPLYLKEGETTWVRVYNNMADLNMTVHWHGLTLRTAPFSDGTPLVSQWPILPGQYFDYEIHPEEGDAGTYFYHSHIGFQASTAHGMLYVEDCNAPPYQYDEDVPIMMSDFYEKTDGEIVTDLLSVPFVFPGEPDAVIFNDRTGTASFDDAVDDSCKPYVVNFVPGMTYRLRILSATTLSFISLGIEGHTNLTVISADGYYTKPASTDHIQLGGGQRFDVLLTAKTADELAAEGKDQYWIRYESRGRNPDRSGYALLQYDTSTTADVKRSNCFGSHGFGGMGMHGLDRGGNGVNGGNGMNRGGGVHGGNIVIGQNGVDGGNGVNSGQPARSPGKNPDQPPVQLPPDGDLNDWLEYTLEQLKPPERPFPKLSEVTRTLYITVNEQVTNGTDSGGRVDGGLIWVQNGLTWTELEAQDLHYTPYLIEAYQKGTTPDYDAAITNHGWDPVSRAFPARVGEVLDIVWQSNSGPTGGFQYHPMHAHGEHYYDLGAGNGTYDPVANEKHFDNYTPMKRDSTMLYRYTAEGAENTTAGWRAWRIRITDDNVGAWMMHCHILHHMVMGMQSVWVFGDAASMLREIPEPYIQGYLDAGGDAYGNESYDPLVLSYF